MRILFITDAWHPQLNGVVRTIEETKAELERRTHVVDVIGPDRFRTFALPTYRDIRLAFPRRAVLDEMIRRFRPDMIHIATEGPLGWAARRWCLRNRARFSTAYHTRFPEYIARRVPIPLALSYTLMQRFHAPSSAVMVATRSIADDLERRDFRNVKNWTRGVDTQMFRPHAGAFEGLACPLMLYAGRIAVEKNLRAFLALDLAGTKIVTGDGPQSEELKRDFPAAVFTGRLEGDTLAAAYSAADVFVFPSLTDTFGLVLAEALACGTPVAAFNVPGPSDVLLPQDKDAPVGVVGNDLAATVTACLDLHIPAERCRDFVLRHYTWARATDQFLDNAPPICNDLAHS